MEVINKFNRILPQIVNDNEEILDIKTISTKINLYNNDFLLLDWSNASVLFANSTCFSTELMIKLSKKAEKELKIGTFFITFTKKLPELSEKWSIQPGFRRVMSWGIATIYIHHKIK